MKALLQRVTQAKIEIVRSGLLGGDKQSEARFGSPEVATSEIGSGFLVFLGVGQKDTEQDINYLVNKIINLRVFADQNGKFNLSVKDIKGSLLIVSQFTLFADTKKGNRPGFTNAAPPSLAEKLYNQFINKCKDLVPTQTGQFAAHMQISLVNDGPVTIMLDSKKEKL